MVTHMWNSIVRSASESDCLITHFIVLKNPMYTIFHLPQIVLTSQGMSCVQILLLSLAMILNMYQIIASTQRAQIVSIKISLQNLSILLKPHQIFDKVACGCDLGLLFEYQAGCHLKWLPVVLKIYLLL